METNIVKLNTLTSLITKGTTPSNVGDGFCDSGIMFFRSELVGKSKYIDKSSGLLYISEETDKKLKRSRIIKNDILFSMAGAYLGKVSIVGPNDYPANTNQAVAIIRLKDNVANVDYIYYYMKQKWFNDYVCSLTAQAAQPNINLEQIGKLRIIFPPLPTQRRIASILSTYDALIQNYKRQIAALQSAASELYKEWFVRFRFPGYKSAKFTNSRIGRIPTTFDVKKQNEVITNHIGGGWGEDEQSENFPIEAAVVRGTDFPEFANGNISTCPIRYHKASNYNARVIEPNDIILEVSGGTQEQPVGRTVIVSKDRLDRFNNKLICASFCKLIKLNKSVITPFFYFYWMQFVYDTRIITRYQLQSTGIINFKFEYFLRKGDVLIPTKELMESFDSKVQLIHTQIEKLAIAITNLTTQRDLLLPRLMSGKLSVE